MQHTSASSPAARILVVDDVPTNLHLLEKILLDRGYDVRLAPDGAMALQFAQSYPPDIILLDVGMPDMDGFEVCEQLKANPDTRAIPVLFISALGEIQDKLKGFAVGGIDYITKPFQAEEVLARVNTHLTLHALRQNLEQEIDRRIEAEEELHTLNEQLHTANAQLEDANHQLDETNQQLQHTIASKDKFFSIIAHDLRAPFQGLLTLTQFLAQNIDNYDRDNLKKKLNLLHDASENVYDLLTNLLTWSRLERGIIEYEPGSLMLEGILERNRRLLLPNAEQKHITVSLDVPKNPGAYGDFKMIDTVVRNLLSNAVKFTDSGGSITLSAKPAGGATAEMIEIAVADTGNGIEPQALEKLFRIDIKYSKPGTAGEQGTGLGLILCKELVEKNGGTIRVESTVGKGSVFTFTLPRQQPEKTTT